jgi:hypothetical protein
MKIFTNIFFYCSNVAELKKAVHDFGTIKMTPEYCKKYISRLKKVIKIVIENKGGWSYSYRHFLFSNFLNFFFHFYINDINLP